MENEVAECRVAWLGTVGYVEALAIQRRLAAERLDNTVPDTLLLLEHPPTITLGRAADRANVLLDANGLRERGVEVVETDRGGDVTYHGPGQLVGYPILDLSEPPHVPDLHRYLRSLEQTVIGAIGECGVVGGRYPVNTGVWTGLDTGRPKKIAAIGIRVSRWITQHGFALNVDPDISAFEWIVPCGIRDYGVTSMARTLGRPIAVGEVCDAVIRSFETVFGVRCIEIPASDIIKE